MLGPRKRSRILRSKLLVIFAVLIPVESSAGNVISVYSGVQSAMPSQVLGTDDLGAPFDFNADWLGRSLAMPPYYGVRAMRWSENSPWGFGLEFTHTKVYASDATLASGGFPMLEFTNGLNILTFNALRKFEAIGQLQPYLGAGIGISIPHVEVQTRVGGPVTFEYQFGGPAIRALAGVEYELSDNWSLFGEFNATYSSNDAELTGGGTLSTDVVTQALNLGASFRF